MTDSEKWLQLSKPEMESIKKKTGATDIQAAILLSLRELNQGIQNLGEEMSGLAAILNDAEDDPY